MLCYVTLFPIDSASSLATLEACLSASNLPLRHSTVFRTSSVSTFLQLKWHIEQCHFIFVATGYPISQCIMNEIDKERESERAKNTPYVVLFSSYHLHIICTFFNKARHHLWPSDQTPKVWWGCFPMNREKGNCDGWLFLCEMMNPCCAMCSADSKTNVLCAFQKKNKTKQTKKKTKGRMESCLHHNSY